MLTLTLEPGMDPQNTLEATRTRVSDKGRVVIPVQFREVLGIKAGDLVNLEIVDDELRISTFAGRLKRTRERLKQYATPGKLAYHELIEERRREARKEEGEFAALNQRLDHSVQADD
jgi:AbrB family looped-hinge helix DNA binding protein